jgi:hypothetical protein
VFHSVRRAKPVAILDRIPRTAQQGANFRKDPLTKLLEIHMRLASVPLHARQMRCALTIVGAAFCCTLSACMTAKIEEVRQAPTKIGSNEAIVLLAKPHLEGAATEDQFLDCLEQHLVGAMVSAHAADRQRAGKKVDARSNLTKSPFQIYADAQFIDALYPWLEPSTAPANAQAFSSFLSRPGVTDRVTEMGVRYVVWVDGTTQKTDGGGSIACAAGPGGAGCLGLGWWQKTSDYERGIVVDRCEGYVVHDRCDRAYSFGCTCAEHSMQSIGWATEIISSRHRRRRRGTARTCEIIYFVRTRSGLNRFDLCTLEVEMLRLCSARRQHSQRHRRARSARFFRGQEKQS